MDQELIYPKQDNLDYFYSMRLFTMSLYELGEIIGSATSEQRQNFAKLTGSAFGSSPETLCNHICYLRSGAFGQLFCNTTWKQIATDVADHAHINWTETLDGRRWKDLKTDEIENAVVTKVFQDMFNKLTQEQKEQFILSMDRNSDDPNLQTFLLTGGAMTAAKVSGFGVYLMASTVLGGLTNALGITLPFAIYMGMSQVIALILGPVGWLTLFGGLAFTLNQPNWHRLTLAVIYTSIIRHELAKSIES
ncbi:MAG: hypothetical protein F6K42_05305 [Leptolyngbya sp. SIO1D8]|nr:hypothetical protein [Leptolyngbya sp. SIO1D8]